MSNTNETNDRVEQYVEQIKTNHGLLDTGGGRRGVRTELTENNIDYSEEETRTIDNTDWEIIKYTSNTEGVVYAAEKWERVAIDDVQSTTYTFDHSPTNNDIKSIDKASELKLKVQYGKLPEEFTCWECGQETHILDIPHKENAAAGNKSSKLTTIMRFAKDKYCNRC